MVGGLHKTQLRGLKKVSAQTVFTFAAYNLTRMGGLFGWRRLTAWVVVRLKSARRRETPGNGEAYLADVRISAGIGASGAGKNANGGFHSQRL